MLQTNEFGQIRQLLKVELHELHPLVVFT